jgi:PAS domain S-box-containing protein
MKPNNPVFKRYFLLICICMIIISLYALSFSTSFFNKNLQTKDLSKFYIFSSIFIILITLFFIQILYIFYRKLNRILKKSSETIHRYDALSNATNDAIWDVDLRTNAVFYNERVSNIFGFEKEDLANNTEWWESNIHPDDKERVLAKMNGLLELNRNSWEDEYRFQCKDGAYKNVFDRSFIVRNSEGKPIRLIGAMKDVTKMRTMEKLLLDKQLQHKNLLGKNIIAENESERKKVKDLLHEDVSQILVSVKYFLSMLKTEQKQENVTTSIQYLDEVITKINNISNRLFSSTFDIFGLKDGINDLRLAYERDMEQAIKLDLEKFEETSTDKNLSLQIYRIIEDRLAQIINQIKGRDVAIFLSNRNDIVHLDICFTSDEIDVLKKLTNNTSNLFGKIELHNGEIKMHANSENEYTVTVIFNIKGNNNKDLEILIPWLKPI